MVLLESEYIKMKNGNSAPDFKLMNIDNKSYKLSEIKGKKATLIIFMCNHCPYVIPKIVELNRINKDFEELTVIGINSNDDKDYPEDSFENMKKMNINFYYLRDETQEIAKNYGAVCTPDPFIFNEELELIYHGRIDPAHMKKTKVPELYNVIKEFLETGTITKEEMPSQGCSIKWKY